MPPPASPPLAPPHGLPVVHLVDDEPVIREALGWLLRSRRLLSEAHASAEDFDRLLQERGERCFTAPCCVLLDIRMPGLSGLEMFERLAERGLLQRLPVIFLTGHGDVATAVAAIQRGAFDFVEKPFSDNALVDRVERALMASKAALEADWQRAGWRARLAELTDREREVMELVVEGRPNKLIADALAISVRTVEVHRARVFDKLGVRSAVELARQLHGLTPPG